MLIVSTSYVLMNIRVLTPLKANLVSNSNLHYPSYSDSYLQRNSEDKIPLKLNNVLIEDLLLLMIRKKQ